MEASKQGLEQEIQFHQSRIAALERSRAAVEANLLSTRSTLQFTTESEDRLRQELQKKAHEIANLEQDNGNKSHVIEALEIEKDALDETLRTRTLEHQELNTYTATLKDNVDSLQIKLESAVRYESSLQDRLAEKESSREDLRKRLDRGTQHIALLEQRIADYELEVAENSTLRDELGKAEDTTNDTRNALTNLETEMSGLRLKLQSESETHSKLVIELASNRAVIIHGEEELRDTKNMLQQEVDAKHKLESELASMRSAYDASVAKLKDAQSHIESLEDVDDFTQAKLETLRDNKASLEADLKEARQSLFTLREDLRMGSTQLREMKSSTSKLQRDLQVSESRVSSLEEELREAGVARAAIVEQHSTDVQKSNTQFSELESSMLSLRAVLDSSERLKVSLEEELQQVQTSKDAVETHLHEARLAKSDLQNKCNSAQAQLESTGTERKDLQIKLTQLENDLTVSSTSKATLEDRLKVALEESEALQAIVSELETSLTDSRGTTTRLEEALATAQIDGDASSADIATLHNQLNEARTAKEELSSRLQDALSLKTVVENQLVSAQEDGNASNTEIASLHNQLNEARTAREKLDLELQAAVSRATEVESQLVSAQTYGAASGAEIANLHHQLSKANTAREELVSRLQDAVSLRGAVEDQLASAQLDGEASSVEVADLHVQLEEVTTAREELDSKLQDALNLKMATESQLVSAQAKLADMDTEVIELRSRLSTVLDERAQIEESKAGTDQRLKTVQESYDLQHKELTSTRLLLQAVEEEAKQLRMRSSAAEEQLNAIQHDKATVDQRLEEVLDTNRSLKEELTAAKTHEANTENRLQDAIDSNGLITKEILFVQSQLQQASTDKTGLDSRLTDKNQELDRVRQLQSDTQRELGEALAMAATLGRDLSSTRSGLHDIELQNVSNSTKISGNEEELTRARYRETELKEKLQQVEKHSGSLQDQVSLMHSRVTEIESSKADLASQLSSNNKTIDGLRAAHDELDGRLQATSQRNGELEGELRATQMRLNIAENEGSQIGWEAAEAKKALAALRSSNIELEISKQVLTQRLASAEGDLETVRTTNVRLEEFLERVQTDMATTEAAVTESGKRLENFLQESQAKLDAAKASTLRHKRRLSERNTEIETLISENSDLHNQIGKQTQDLEALERGKAKLEEQLLGKDAYIKELSSSSGKRIRSLNSAYNGLKKEYEQRLQQNQPGMDPQNVGRLRAELQSKNAEIEKMRKSVSSFSALEQEVRTLREDKKTFERVVEQLQHKARQLQVLEEWQESSDVSGAGRSRHVTIMEEPDHSAVQSHSPRPPVSPRPDSLQSSVTSIGHPSVLHERPVTRGSMISSDEDMDSWVKEVERVRTLRDETAIQLRDLKMSKHNLKRELKNTEAELHRLEKEGRPYVTAFFTQDNSMLTEIHSRNLLRKGRPSTPFRMFAGEPGHISPRPKTPIRPVTSSGIPSDPQPNMTSHHSAVADSPSSSTGHSESRRWSTMPRSTTPFRPETSHSHTHKLRQTMRPVTGVEEEESRPKDKRRWSSGLKSLFHVT